MTHMEHDIANIARQMVEMASIGLADRGMVEMASQTDSDQNTNRSLSKKMMIQTTAGRCTHPQEADRPIAGAEKRQITIAMAELEVAAIGSDRRGCRKKIVQMPRGRATEHRKAEHVNEADRRADADKHFQLLLGHNQRKRRDQIHECD